MLSAEKLVDYLEEKGIGFTLISKDGAVQYLKNNNNYFKLGSYRKNYATTYEGKYKDLEFAYLIDLAIIDMNLRYTIIQLALDVEHFLKVELLRKIEELDGEDGYTICEDYIKSLDEKTSLIFKNEIERNIDNIYCGGIVSKYKDDWPVWAFLEVVPFARVVDFYKFCADRFQDKRMNSLYFQLLACKDIRNAAAHSSCILNDLHLNTAQHKTSYEINYELAHAKGISRSQYSKRMTNARMQQIVTLLYVHKEVIKSDGVHEKACNMLYGLKQRMNKNINYYDTNELIKKTIDFLGKIIDNWFSNP